MRLKQDKQKWFEFRCAIVREMHGDVVGVLRRENRRVPRLGRPREAVPIHEREPAAVAHLPGHRGPVASRGRGARKPIHAAARPQRERTWSPYPVRTFPAGLRRDVHARRWRDHDDATDVDQALKSQVGVRQGRQIGDAER
jgi:hypothetical protein